MLKIIFTLFLSIFSLNLFAVDFMQRDFKVTLQWLENKPKSSARDFFILQYLKDENISYEDAKKAYDMRNGRNALLDKTFKQKFNDKLTPEDRFCYNASISELKNSDSRCIALGLSSLKKASNLSKNDLIFFISKLDSYPTLKNNLKLLAMDNIFKHLTTQANADKFLEIFFGVSDEFLYKNLNRKLGEKFLKILSSHKDFEKFLSSVIYNKNLITMQKSFDNLKIYKNLSNQFQFTLGLNAINHKNLLAAKEFFENSLNNSFFRSDKDKALFWLYLVTDNKKYLDDLASSFDINLYSVYAKELLNIKIDNVVYDLKLSNKPTTFDIYDIFSWMDIVEDSKKNLDETKIQNYYELFSDESTMAHLVFILERFNKHKIHYFITPYEEFVNQYGVYKKILLYSIARQESRFIPASISFSGAQGMMQIMPFLSKDIAQKLKEDYNIYEQFIPQKNLQYASFHLDSLIKQFDSNPLFIAYAYNGGAGYTNSQLKRGLFKTKDKFEPFLSMEMISYNETREYGKKVLTNFYIYNNYLNSENKISLSTIFESLIWQH